MEWTPDGKRGVFRDLYQTYKDCEKCDLCNERKQIVFGQGSPEACIMFIGEKPGDTEDENGRAFTGEGGNLLSDLCAAAKIPREEMFITNLVMCKTPSDHKGSSRTPTKDERNACLARLHEQIYVIDPVLIIPVGAEAMQALMGGGKTAIQKERGKIGIVKIPAKSQFLKHIEYEAMPILHPVYILKEDKINTKTNNWEKNGHAYNTRRDLVRAREIAEVITKARAPERRGLRLVK